MPPSSVSSPLRPRTCGPAMPPLGRLAIPPCHMPYSPMPTNHVFLANNTSSTRRHVHGRPSSTHSHRYPKRSPIRLLYGYCWSSRSREGGRGEGTRIRCGRGRRECPCAGRGERASTRPGQPTSSRRAVTPSVGRRRGIVGGGSPQSRGDCTPAWPRCGRRDHRRASSREGRGLHRRGLCRWAGPGCGPTWGRKP